MMRLTNPFERLSPITTLVLWAVVLGINCSDMCWARTAPLLLSDAEQRLLDDKAEIRIGTMDAWPPMNFIDSNGTPTGIGADYVRAMNTLLGGRLKIVPGPFKENMEKVKSGELDALMDITPKEERKDFFIFTRVYLDIPHAIVAPKKGPYYKSETDLDGKRVALEKGFFNVTYFHQHFPNVRIQIYEDTALALDAVSRGEADAYVGNRAVAAYIMEKELMAGLKFHGRLNKKGSVLAIGVRKQMPELVAVLDKALAAIPPEEVKAIHRRWTNSKVSDDDSDRLSQRTDELSGILDPSNISSENRQWIFFIVLLTAGIAMALMFLIRTIRRDRVAMSFGSTWFKVTVVIGLVVFVMVVSGLGWILMNRMKYTVRKDVASHMNLVLSLIQDRTGMWLEKQMILMQRLGMEPALVDATCRLLKIPQEKEALMNAKDLAFIRQFFQAGQDICHNPDFFIINKSRVSIAARADADLGTENKLADRYPEIVDSAFQGKAGFTPLMHPDLPVANEPGRNPKPLCAYFLLPVQTADGQIIAVTAIGIDPVEDLGKLTRFPSRWKSCDIYMFDENGWMITPGRFDTQLAQLGLLSEEQNSAITIQLRDPGVDLTRENPLPAALENQPFTRLVRQALGLGKRMADSPSASGIPVTGADTTGYRNYRGVTVFGAWGWNIALNMGLAVEIDMSEAMADFYRIRMTVIAILGVTLVLSVVSVLLVLVLGDRSRKALETSRDDLEHKVTERTLELKENQERFAALLESAPDAMVVSDDSGKITLVNSRAEGLFEYHRSELTDACIDMLVPDDVRQSHPGKRALFFNTPAVQTRAAGGMELTARTKSGRLIPVEICLSPIQKRSGCLVVASIRDITDRKRAEQQIRDKFDELNRFRRLAVGRETKMIQLKEEINELAGRLGENPRHKIRHKIGGNDENERGNV